MVKILKKMEISKDLDKMYEKQGFIERIFTFPLFLLLNSKLFHSTAKSLLKKSSTAKKVKDNATTHVALEAVYAFDHQIDRTKGFFVGLINYILQKYVKNAKALRNRLKLVKKELRIAISSIEKEDITILNLGAGSARSVLETVAEFKNKKIKVVLLDLSQKALDDSKEIIKNSDIRGEFIYIREHIMNVDKALSDLSPDIVEMVGLLDYFDEKDSIDIVNKVYSIMPPGSVFITGNILPNKEEPFLTNLLNWPLIYMNFDELSSIIKKSNFEEEKARIIYEPLKIHAVLKLIK